jgi:predicted phosphodiesterase
MRVAALYDIHGNLTALEAVLDDLRREAVDLVVVGGDVAPGPMPRESLERLLALPTPVQFIRGNGERAVLAELAGTDPGVPPAVREVIRWNAEQLQPFRPLLDSWPSTLRVTIPSFGDVLFCHATPRSDSEIVTRATPVERLRPVFDDTGAAIVVCGHTHMPFDRLVGATRVVNAGSVGMPFGEPGAYWAILGPDVSLRRTGYDLADAARRVRATSYPQAEAVAAREVLNPMSEAEALALFAPAGL